MIENLKRIYRELFRNPPKATVNYKSQTERHGNTYGGWNIIPESINSESVVYSFGIGQDVSFDLSIIKKYNCKVHAFDPTPRVINWLEGQNLPNNFIFHPIGLNKFDGELTFFSPKNEKNISHTIIQNTNSEAITVKGNRLHTIMKNLNHEKIDLLKMDIEGFEYGVIQNMIEENIRPKQLLIEFHHFFPEIGNYKTESMIKLLKTNNYSLFSIADSFCEYSFVSIE